MNKIPANRHKRSNKQDIKKNINKNKTQNKGEAMPFELERKI